MIENYNVKNILNLTETIFRKQDQVMWRSFDNSNVKIMPNFDDPFESQQKSNQTNICLELIFEQTIYSQLTPPLRSR